MPAVELVAAVDKYFMTPINLEVVMEVMEAEVPVVEAPESVLPEAPAVQAAQVA